MYRIFIVEDDDTIADIMKKHLESWGYEVTCACDFEHVLQIGRASCRERV